MLARATIGYLVYKHEEVSQILVRFELQNCINSMAKSLVCKIPLLAPGQVRIVVYNVYQYIVYNQVASLTSVLNHSTLEFR